MILLDSELSCSLPRTGYTSEFQIRYRMAKAMMQVYDHDATRRPAHRPAPARLIGVRAHSVRLILAHSHRLDSLKAQARRVLLYCCMGSDVQTIRRDCFE